tara:strand:- start:6603 stop:11213 length:4611 start_codon:yes stop_codon:yes gene_type:complete
MSDIPNEEMTTDGWGDGIDWGEETSPWGEETSENKSEWGITPKMGEQFIVLFKDGNKFLGIVNDIENEEGKYFTLKNGEKSLLFQTKEGVVVLKTEDYEILDIQRIKSYDMKLLEIPSSLQEKLNETNDIAYSSIDTKDRVYSKQELKEMLISTLYEQYNRDTIIKTFDEIIDYAEILLNISGEENKGKRKIGKWCLPIISNEVRLYGEEKEIVNEITDLIENDKLITDKNNKQDKNYVNLIKNLLHLSDNIVNDETNEGVSINDYEGKLYRNCLNMNNCSGINGLYSFDEVRNNRHFHIPTSFDRVSGDSHFLEIRKPMNINILGVLTLPYHYYPYIYDSLLYNNSLSLYEKCILQELMKQTNLQKRDEFKKNTISTKQFKKEDYKYELDTFTIHKLTSNNKDELVDDIHAIKPSISDLMKTLDEKILKSIKSYSDITKLFVNYDVKYGDLEKDYKMINETLTKNSLNDKKNSKIFNLKKKKIIKKELDIEKRITLSKHIIFGMLNISVRNLFIKRFINTFCVESSDEKDKHWYLGIHDKKRLLCKHYSYLTTEKNEEQFHLMKQQYQKLPPEDGNIYCKNCGEFICQEEFSHDDGFTDDMPTSTKEVLIVEKDLFEKYDESDMNNIGLLKDIAMGMGAELKDDDIVLIIDTYSSLSEDIIANKRYGTINITKGDEHPRVREIKKTHKKDKKLMTKHIKSFQIFLKVTNRILVLISLSLLIIGTSVPIYENKYIQDFKLFQDDYKLNKDFIMKMTHVLKRVSHSFGEKYEKIYLELVNERKNYDVSPVDEQIHNLLSLFLTSSFPKLGSRFEIFLKFKKSVNNIYTNYEWPIYKPLSSNKLVKEINTKVNSDKSSESLLIRTYNIINVENITNVSGTNDYDLQTELNIEKNDLINTAFQRLFNSAVSLHGHTEKPNFFIDTNMEKFFNESTDAIKDICIKSGWNNKTKTMGPISFKELRSKFIPAIFKNIYENTNNELVPCFTLKEHCNDYIHANINNYDLCLLNVPSKRFYKHTTPDIFPSVNYSILKDEMKDKIFKTFAFDPLNNIIKRELNTNYLGKFLIDINTDVNIEDNIHRYEKEIPKNEKNFHKIIEYMHTKSRLNFQYISLPQEITGDSLKNYLKKDFINEYFELFEGKEFTFDQERFLQILEILEENKENIKDVGNDLTQIYLDIEEENNKALEIIGTLMISSFKNYPKLKERFQNIFVSGKVSHIKMNHTMRKELESYGQINYKNLTGKNIEDILRIIIEDKAFDLDYIKDVSNELLFLVSNIINTGFKNSHIPKSWRLSDINKEWFKKYVDTHYFSHHRDIYTQRNFSTFEEYFTMESKENFKELYEKIEGCVRNVESLRNTSTNVLTENIKSLWKHIFLNLIKQILLFSDDLRHTLEMEGADDEMGDVFEKLSLELIIHLFEKRFDQTWIYSEKDNLNELLGFQKEREKQKLIHKLDGMSNDKRHAATELHTIGTKNHFKASEIENMEHIEDEKYKQEMDDESYIQEIMGGNLLQENTIVIQDDMVNEEYETGEFIDDDGGNM